VVENMNHKYLPNSETIRESISDLFSGSDEKIAIAAFVGKNAIDYLPNPKNTTVICWPKAGGTNPDGVRRLLDAGFEVKFCDNLHSKIYWCKGKGVIISSANLSDNALGDGGLIEYGVFIEDREFNFSENVLTHIRKKLRQIKDEELDQLDIDSNKYNRTNKIKTNSTKQNLNYLEWFQRKHKQKWKIVWYSAESKVDNVTKNEVFKRCSVTTWNNDNDVESGVFREGDLVFQFKMDETEEYIKRANGKWLFVDMITSTKKIIQVDLLDNNVSVPFEIDSSFRKSFKKALSELGWDKIRDDKQYPKKGFLKRVYDYYQQISNQANSANR
jgi:hypothetical protein